MQFKKIILILIISLIAQVLLAFSAPPGGREDKYPSAYKEGIVVNGNSSEWDNSLFSYNKNAMANYAIVNDSTAIYVCVRIADEPTQMKVLKSGIEIRFNSRGKKKAEAMLHFPIGGNVGMTGNRDRKTMHLMYLLQMQDMDLAGFKNGVNGFQNVKSGKNGVMAAMNWDSVNVMVYEARIPMAVFVQDVSKANPLSVGIIIKGQPKPKNPQTASMPEGNPTDMQSGRGQERPGGMRPGAGMEGQEGEYSGNSKMFEDDEIWKSIVIAKKPAGK